MRPIALLCLATILVPAIPAAADPIIDSASTFEQAVTSSAQDNQDYAATNVYESNGVSIRWLAAAGYWVIARNRHRLPGSTPACRLPKRRAT